MLKKTVNYQNLDGYTIAKDLYFNISSNELLEKETASDSEFSEKLKLIGESTKISEIYPAVIELLGMGYGERTPEGEFLKDPTGAAFDKFKLSQAYDALMEDLLLDQANNGSKLADFLNGMLPEKLLQQVRENVAVPGFRPGADTNRPTPPIASQQPSVEAAPAQTPPAIAEPVALVQTSEPRQPDISGQ